VAPHDSLVLLQLAGVVVIRMSGGWLVGGVVEDQVAVGVRVGPAGAAVAAGRGWLLVGR
jgi:hypothetical protein